MTYDVFSQQALETFGLTITQAHYAHFRVYVDLMRSWADRVRLVSTNDKDHIWERHILDCLSIIASLPQNGVVLDLGSGSGLPGIPIKIMRSDLSVVLLEPARMKALFLQQVVEKLQLNALTCIRERAEILAKNPEHHNHYDAVVARAVGPLPELWAFSKPLLNDGGSFIGMKGPDSLTEFGEMVPEDVEFKEQIFNLSFLQRKRAIVILTKSKCST